MKHMVLALAALSVGGAAQAAIPTLNATCPGGIELHVGEGGYAYINGTAAKVKMYDASAFDATLGSTTVSVTMNPDGTATVVYTAAGGANGVCQAEVYDG